MKSDIEICKNVEQNKLLVLLTDGLDDTGAVNLSLFFKNLTALEIAVIKRILSYSGSTSFHHYYGRDEIRIMYQDNSSTIYFKKPDRIETELILDTPVEYYIYENKGDIINIVSF